MKAHRFLAALWIALALLLGQQAAALHDLAHATEQLGGPLKAPAGKHTCDQCFLSAQLSGAVGTHVAIPPVVMATVVAAAFSFLPALSRTVVSSRSRAPPAA
jgi:hypothetical protein